jgi:hypothetical protein
VPFAAKRMHIVFFLDDFEDFGRFLQAKDMGMEMYVAPVLCEGELLVGRDFLISKEDDAVIKQGAMYLLEGNVVYWIG